MNSEQPYPPMMPQAPQPVFNQPPYPSTAPPRPTIARYTGQKIRIAFYATLIFLALSHIGAYRLVNMIYNAITSKSHEIVNEQGEPTMKGLLLHGIIFFLAIMFLLA